jgi:hypothetical protein
VDAIVVVVVLLGAFVVVVDVTELLEVDPLTVEADRLSLGSSTTDVTAMLFVHLFPESAEIAEVPVAENLNRH